MARAITWRNVNAQSQADAFRFNELGNQQINAGLSGLQSQLTGAAKELEQEAYQSALGQINALGTVDAARQARDNNFVDQLANGDVELANRLRTDLNNRTTQLQQRYTNDIRFDDLRTDQKERGTVASLEQAIANRDLAGINASLGNLSQETRAQYADRVAGLRNELKVGDLLTNINAENIEDSTKAFESLSSDIKGQYAPQFYGAIEQARKKGINDRFKETLTSLDADRDQYALDKFLLDNPEYDGQVFINNGQLELSDATPDDNTVINSLFQEGASDYYEGAPTYNDRINDFKEQNSDLTLAELNAVSEVGKQFASNDSRYVQREAARKQQKAINDNLAKYDAFKAIENNPENHPAFAPFKDIKDYPTIYSKFDGLTVGGDGLFDSEGDKQNFVKAADSVVQTGYKDANGNTKRYNPEVVGAALSMTTAVLKAHKTKELGDENALVEYVEKDGNEWLSSLLRYTPSIFQGVYSLNAAGGRNNIDKKEFKKLLNRMQAVYEEGNVNRRENDATRRRALETGLLTFEELQGSKR